MFESLDISILREINLNRITGLDGLFSFISNSAPIIAPLIPIFIILFGAIKKKRDIWLTGFWLGVPYLLSVIISNILKYTIERPRPFKSYTFIQKLSSGGSGSFPSGHTSDAFSIAMIISFLFPRKLVIIPMFAWAILVAYSRMDLGVHYPSDVLAGAVIGISSSLVCSQLYRRWKEKDFAPK
jgi:membrane-associated phospholipid phosphatase